MSATHSPEASLRIHRPGARTLPRRLLPVVACAALTILLAGTVLGDGYPAIDLHVPWWLLAAMFAFGEVDGLGLPPERRSLTSPAARIPLVIGLCLVAPLELLIAQQVGTALVLATRFRNAPLDTVFVLSASGLATALGAWAYMPLTGDVAQLGPALWLDGTAAAAVVVLASAALSSAWFAPRPRSFGAMLRWVRTPLLTDILTVATGLVALEIILSDRYAAWLLVLPALAAFAVRRRYETTSRRAEALKAQHQQDVEVLQRLDEINRELQRISDAKTVFLSTTSHELRAPLTALLAEAELLDEMVGEPDKVDACRRLVRGVDLNTRHLMRLVDDLLDLSRIEAGQLELTDEAVDLTSIADDVVAALYPVAAAEGIDLVLEHRGPAPMRGDPGRLWQVIANLVENARAATPSPGRVTVSVETTPAGPCLGVSDTGVGMTAEHLERIFAAFEHGPSGHQGGLGLGLTIARHLVERHGGTLSAASTPDVGSCFTAQLPAVDRAMAPNPQR